METSTLEVGRFYAYREKRRPGDQPLKVKLLAVVGRGGKVKIRFEDGPFPGLAEYANSRQLIVPWGQAKAFLRDEERAERIKAHERTDGLDSAVGTAVEVVLESTGEAHLWLSSSGISCPVDPLVRVMQRAGLEGKPEDLDPLGFVDRHEEVHLPSCAAVIVAPSFATAEPNTVAMYLEAQEAELRAQGYIPGDRFHHEYLRTQRPGFALARQWAGFENELQTLPRLHGLLGRAASDLRAAGAEREAWRLERAKGR